MLAIVLLASNGNAQTAKLINDLACKAMEKENFVYENGIAKLYGIRTNGPDTNNGTLACAKVISIILKRAGAINDILLCVGQIETALSNWKKIENENDLKPGDIIVWLNRHKGKKDKKCTSGGNCHIGVVTDKGYFHNSPLSHIPTFNGVPLGAYKFKIGYRPPD